ncbi:MAG: TadE/TadG family type IV pilus assembly protein [Terracidiphilus sp.]|jgi:Flp pilus assembly protein TadG
MKILARFRSFCKTNRGNAMVELALVTPFLLALLFGAIDLGRAYYVGIMVTNAAHAAAEYGSQFPSDTAGMTTAAQQSAPNITNLVVTTPTYGCECSDGSLYKANCSTTPVCTASSTVSSTVVKRVQVTASSTYHTLVPWGVIPSTFTLTNTATVRGN